MKIGTTLKPGVINVEVVFTLADGRVGRVRLIADAIAIERDRRRVDVRVQGDVPEEVEPQTWSVVPR